MPTSRLTSIRPKYGPTALIERFMGLADAHASARGLKLEIRPLREAAAAQAENTDTWAKFPPMLDSRLSDISDASSYSIIGSDDEGRVRCAQAGRIYDSGDRSFADLVADQSFCYGSSRFRAGMPRAEVSIPSAGRIKGRFVYSGALWVHPEYTGKGFPSILVRVSRTYALAHWNTEYTIGMVRDFTDPAKMSPIYGYPVRNFEKPFTFYDLDVQPMHWYVMHMSRDELIDDLERYISAYLP